MSAESGFNVIGPVVLEGRLCRLDPLNVSHLAALTSVGLDESIWRWNKRPVVDAPGMRRYVSEALAARDAGSQQPFVIVSKSDATVVGSTRYGNIDLDNRRVEIGWTWLAPPWQRSGINREAKLLLLTHAFEELGCVRVEFKTDVRNSQSRNALLGIGAVEEGVLRKHIRIEAGGYRDTIYYSILDDEWPNVKRVLEEGLQRRDRS